MSQLQRAVPHCLLPILILPVLVVHQCVAELGTAVQSNPLPPQTLTTCRYNTSLFPPGLLFATAGDQIWDNGGACRRRYRVWGLRGDRPNACRRRPHVECRPHVGCRPRQHVECRPRPHVEQSIEVTIVEQASRVGSRFPSNRATMMLSPTAYRAIADLSARSINIRFERILK